MPKLHELLAVDGNLKSQSDKTRGELIHTFSHKPHHFTEKVVTFRSAEEGVPDVVESKLEIQTTVPRELIWISTFIAKSINVSYHVAEANTSARADIELEDGTILARNIPATSLLELEKRAAELHAFVMAIPTLDPSKSFRPDAEKGAGIFQAAVDNRKRTKKIQKPLIMAPATDKHPAQVQLITEDVATGDIVTMEWSGLITTASKGDMLERVEKFTRAVKQARSRANDTSIDVGTLHKLGNTVVAYVFGL